MIFDIEDHIGAIDEAYRSGSVSRFLDAIVIGWVNLFKSQSAFGHALFEPTSDALMRRTAESLHVSPRRAPDDGLVLHVSTEVSDTGGHTRVIEDIAWALPDKRHLLVLTDIRRKFSSPEALGPVLMERFNRLGIELVFLSKPTLLEKTLELIEIVAQQAPQTIFLSAHHYDAVAFAALCGASAPSVNFLHHMDHLPTLGATRADYVHVDVTPTCHPACQAFGGLQPRLLNMTVPDKGVAAIDWSLPLTGATCGSPGKYRGRADFSYGELLAALIAAGVRRMHHIGTMSEDFQREIRSEIQRAGQDDQAVTFHPNTPSLAGALIELAPHFFLPSHPTLGGKASIEALSAGLPVVRANPQAVAPLLRVDFTCGAGIMFESLREVPAAIRQLASEGPILAAASRKMFEDNYSERAFREHVGHLSDASPLKTPPDAAPISLFDTALLLRALQDHTQPPAAAAVELLCRAIEQNCLEFCRAPPHWQRWAAGILAAKSETDAVLRARVGRAVAQIVQAHLTHGQPLREILHFHEIYRRAMPQAEQDPAIASSFARYLAAQPDRHERCRRSRADEELRVCYLQQEDDSGFAALLRAHADAARGSHRLWLYSLCDPSDDVRRICAEAGVARRETPPGFDLLDLGRAVEMGLEQDRIDVIVTDCGSTIATWLFQRRAAPLQLCHGSLAWRPSELDGSIPDGLLDGIEICKQIDLMWSGLGLRR